MDKDIENRIRRVVAGIIHDAPYWAHELRTAKLATYLLQHGRALELRLLTCSAEEQELIGLTSFRANVRATLQTMLDTGVAPPMNRMRNRLPNEVRAFARRGLYSMIVDEMLVGVGAERIALSFSITGNGYTTEAFKVGSVEELLAEIERIGLRYELANFVACAASSKDASDESGL